jgi:uncharacterized protein YjbI with pentapeptide repeats
MELTRATVTAHEAWLNGSRTGERLVVEGRRYVASSFQVWDLTRVRVRNTEFEECDLRHATLRGTEWSKSQLRRTLLLSARCQSASFEEVLFDTCNLNLGRFNRAVLKNSILVDTQAFRSQWGDATLAGIDFIRCELWDTTWNGATVTGSDFRSCNLGATEDFGALATTDGTRFVDCDFRGTYWRGRDLRGATFIRCRFAKTDDYPQDATGAPRATEGLMLIDCDVTREELLGRLLVDESGEAGASRCVDDDDGGRNIASR